MDKLVRGGGFGVSVLVAAGPNNGGRGWVSVFRGLSASVGGAFGLPGGGGGLAAGLAFDGVKTLS